MLTRLIRVNTVTGEQDIVNCLSGTFARSMSH
jgi:hypothetical protein